MPDNSKFCSKCGTKVQEVQNVQEDARNMEEKSVQERTFGPKANSGLLDKALTLGLGVGAILFLYEFSQMSSYFQSEERMIMLILGVGCAAGCGTGLMNWMGNTKVKLCVGKYTVSGITINGMTTRHFEYSYDEISEVRITLGSLLIFVNGKWISIPGIENNEKAKRMIEEKIRNNR